MNPFWKTLLAGFVGIALLFGGSYAKAWIANHTYRADRMTQAERVRLQNEAVDRAIQRSYAQHRTAPQTSYTPPRPFYKPPRDYPNYNKRH